MIQFSRTCLILLLLMTALPAMAANTNMYMDMLGGVADTGDAKGQIATGAVLGIDIGPGLHGVTRIQYSFRPTKYQLAGSRDAFYSHNTITAGIEYTAPIALLKSLGMYWQSSVLAGYGRTAVDVKGIGKESDQGMTLQVFTGLRYLLMQHIAPFVEAGWSHSLYSKKFSENKIYGAQVFIGCRFSLHPMLTTGEDY